MEPLRFGAYLRLNTGTSLKDAEKVASEFLKINPNSLIYQGDCSNEFGEKYGFVATGEHAQLLIALKNAGYSSHNLIA